MRWRRRARGEAPADARSDSSVAKCELLIVFCDMKSLYLRNVPDEVGLRLEALAAREGMSVSSFAIRELSEVARRADNPTLLGGLANLGVSVEDIVEELEAGRTGR